MVQRWCRIVGEENTECSGGKTPVPQVNSVALICAGESDVASNSSLFISPTALLQLLRLRTRAEFAHSDPTTLFTVLSLHLFVFYQQPPIVPRFGA